MITRKSNLLLRLTLALTLLCTLLTALADGLGRFVPADELALDPIGVDGQRDLVLHDLGRARWVVLWESAATEVSPVWSPDGRWIAFASIDQGQQTVYVIGADGRSARPLLTTSASDADNTRLAWSPDGRTLAVTAFDERRQVILLVDAVRGCDGFCRPLTDGAANAFAPTWSPDSRQLAFSWSPVANQEVYIVEVGALDRPVQGARDVQRITFDPGLDTLPAWSPDGTRIALLSNRAGDSDIYLYDVQTAALTRLVQNPARDTSPGWTPDGTRVFFRSNRDGVMNVYIVPADCPSCEPALLFPGDLHPAWRPR